MGLNERFLGIGILPSVTRWGRQGFATHERFAFPARGCNSFFLAQGREGAFPGEIAIATRVTLALVVNADCQSALNALQLRRALFDPALMVGGGGWTAMVTWSYTEINLAKARVSICAYRLPLRSR